MAIIFNKNKCPVCRKYKFAEKYDICPNCGWENDPVQRKNPGFSGGANAMSLNEARTAYKNGEKVR